MEHDLKCLFGETTTTNAEEDVDNLMNCRLEVLNMGESDDGSDLSVTSLMIGC